MNNNELIYGHAIIQLSTLFSKVPNKSMVTLDLAVEERINKDHLKQPL